MLRLTAEGYVHLQEHARGIPLLRIQPTAARSQRSVTHEGPALRVGLTTVNKPWCQEANADLTSVWSTNGRASTGDGWRRNKRIDIFTMSLPLPNLARDLRFLAVIAKINLCWSNPGTHVCSCGATNVKTLEKQIVVMLIRWTRKRQARGQKPKISPLGAEKSVVV